MERGRFITLEGGEGAGKSTQAVLLADFLRERGKEVVVTREPGGSKGAEEIRKLLVEGEPGRWDAMTEMLLNFAARRDHLDKKIWPALSRGAWVVCDRYTDSTVAYQGYGHELGAEIVTRIAELAIGAFAPDLTLVFDLPVDKGLERAGARGGAEDRYERMGLEFHQRLRDGFLEIAKANPERCAVIDATRSIEETAVGIRDVVSKRLGVERL